MLEAIIEIVRECGKSYSTRRPKKSAAKPQPQRPGYLLRHSNSGNSQAKADRAAAGSLFPRRRRKHRLPPGRILFCLRSDRRHRQLCKNYRWSCVSVALLKDGRPQTGVVFNPFADELFTAEKAKALSSTDVRSALPPIRSIFRWPRSAPALMI